MVDAHSEIASLVNRLWVGCSVSYGHFTDMDRAKLLEFGEAAVPALLKVLENDCKLSIEPNWTFAQRVKRIVADIGIGAIFHIEAVLKRRDAREHPALARHLEEMLAEAKKAKLPLPEKFRPGKAAGPPKSGKIPGHQAAL